MKRTRIALASAILALVASAAVTAPAQAARVAGPSTPTNLAVFSLRPSAAVIIWQPSTGRDLNPRYDVFVDGALYSRESSPQVYLQNLTPGTGYTVTVQAVDNRGRRSARSAPLTFRTPSLAPLTAPTNLRTTDRTPTRVTVQWDLSTGGYGIVNYTVYVNGALYGHTIWGSPIAIVSNLTPNTSYTITVQAWDQDGNVSPFSAPLVVRTPAA